MMSVSGPYKISLLCLIWASAMAQASVFRMEGGRFLLNGQLAVQDFIVESGTQLTGAGRLEGSATIYGTIAPGDSDGEAIGTMTIASSLVFHAGSAYACHASTHTLMDTISAEGPVNGMCQLEFSQSAEAIPLDQVVIAGEAGSDYAGFSSSTNIILNAANNDLLITDITGDSNTNNIPDYWEVQYFGGRTDCDPAQDSDTDLMNNWAEYVAGTVPTNAESRLAMMPSPDHSTTEFVFNWSSVSDRNYTILRSTNLTTELFSVLSSNVAATPPLNTFTDSVISLERYYYRIQVEH